MASTTTSSLYCSATGAYALFSDDGVGLIAGYPGNYVNLKAVMILLFGLALYNAIELFIAIFFTFNRFAGLYFWSLIIASLGIVINCIGYLLKFFQRRPLMQHPDLVSVVVLIVGWYAMVTGQSFVLWSRLHLLTNSRYVLKWSFWMIIFGVIMLHFPTTVLLFGSNSKRLSQDTIRRFNQGYLVMEKAQLSGFCVQEFILSGIYIKETLRLLKTSDHIRDNIISEDSPGSKRNRKLMYQLLAINILIIIMDGAVVGLEYANLFVLQVSIKPTVYSVKLKLEFAVLSRLVKIAHTRTHRSDNNIATRNSSVGRDTIRASGSTLAKFKSAASGRIASGDLGVTNLPDFVDPRQISGNLTHAESMSPGRGGVTFAEGWEERGMWARKTRAMTGCWIDEEMDKHNIG